MPRSRNIQFYPREFFDIALKCGRDQQKVRVSCVNVQQARSLAGKFYSFVGALKIAVQDKGGKVTPADMAFYENALPFAHKTQATLTNAEGKEHADTHTLTVVLFQHRGESWYAQAMKRGLENSLGAVKGEDEAQETRLVVPPGSGAKQLVEETQFFSPEAIANRLAEKERKPQDLDDAKRSSGDLLKELGLSSPDEKG